MGYWSTDENGVSFAGDGSLIWGDFPADELDTALADTIHGFMEANHEWPTKDMVLAAGLDAINKIDDQGAVPTYFVVGLRRARDEFTEDIGREPSPAELKAGLLFSLGGQFDDNGRLSKDWIEDHPFDPDAVSKS